MVNDLTDVDIEMESVERGVPKAVKRRELRVNLLVLSLFILFLGAAVIAGVALHSQREIRNLEHSIKRGQDRALCLTRLQSEFESAVGRALSAPPAPNASRDQATADINISAKRLAEAEKICP